MAITKILNIMESEGRNPASHLKNALEYIQNPDKTEECVLVGGINCLPDTAFEQMEETKNIFHKTGKRQGYHVIISFSPEEKVTAEQAMYVLEHFAKDVLGDDYEAVYAVHTDREYSQLFNLLCDKADDVYNGRLPIHVRCLLDEFANIGQIPQFEKLIATIRSREISASIILQSKSQLKALYRDNASTIEGNCDTTLFLGGKEKDTLKDLAEILGKETIDLYNTSDTRGTSQSYGLNYQKTGKELMSQDEIAVMDGSKCIMQLRGVRPFFSDKFDITKHKQYPLLSDYDKKNEFDIEKYVKNLNKLRFKQNDVVDEVCDVGEITA